MGIFSVSLIRVAAHVAQVLLMVVATVFFSRSESLSERLPLVPYSPPPPLRLKADGTFSIFQIADVHAGEGETWVS
jgi:hypothetical protein